MVVRNTGGDVTGYTYSWYSWLRGYAKEVYKWNEAGTDPLIFPPWTPPKNLNHTK
jgi:hypothetical protein